MSVVKDAITAMREVIILSEKVDTAGQLLSRMSTELREHDRRLVRLETMVEVAQAQNLTPQLAKTVRKKSAKKK